MGKGKRNSLRREEDRVQNSEKYLERQKAETQKGKKDKIVALVCVIFAVLIAAVLVISLMNESGVFLRAKTAATIGEIEVDAAMMSYFLNDHILTWYNTYGAYVQYGLFSVNLSADLRTQPYGAGSSYEISMLGEFEDVSTWFDYFFKGAYEGNSQLGTIGVKQYITYAKAAKELGFSLDKEDNAEIKELLKGLDTNLKASNAGYSDWYGQGVKKSDVRKCYELIFLAEKFVEHKNEELTSALDKDDSPINPYIEENKNLFYSADYLSYTITIKSNSYPADELYEKAIAKAREDAKKIEAAKTPAEFVELVDEYKATGFDEDSSEESEETTSKKEETTAKKDGTSTEKETLSPEEESESKYEALKDTIYYETDDELGKWIFGDETSSGAAVGDKNIIEETETATEKETAKKEEATTEKKDGKSATTESGTESETESGSENETSAKKDNTYEIFNITVYYVVKESSLDKTPTMDYAYLASNSKADVERMLETFKAGELTAEKFVEVAQAQYDAVHNDENHEHSDEEMFQFDSVEKAGKGGFNDSYKVLNEWLEEERTPKDISDIMEVTVEKKTYYAVVFFQGYNQEKYYVDAYNGVINEQFNTWYEEESKAVVLNQDVINGLSTIALSASAS